MRTPNTMPAVSAILADRAEMVVDIKRLHAIFVGISGKQIELLTTDPPGRTDTETFVAVPLEDPQADLVHKHEWQHIFFKTDLHARAEFVNKYVERLMIGIPIGSVLALGTHLTEFIHAFCNGIDDIRVASLWHSIYPHSAELIEARWRTILLTTNRFRDDIIMYMMAHGLGLTAHQLGPSRWSKWDRLFIDNMNMVKGAGFPTVLLAARIILDQIVYDVMGEFQPPPPQPQPQQGSGQGAQPGPASPPRRLSTKPKELHRATPGASGRAVGGQNDAEEAKQDLLMQLVRGADLTTKDSRFADTPKTVTPDPDRRETEQIVATALGASTDAQLRFVLAKSQKDMDLVVAALRNHVGTTSTDQRLLRGLDGKAVFKDVHPGHVNEQRLLEGDKRLVERLRRTFTKLMDKVKRRLGDSGSALDPAAFIDLLMGSNDGDVFEEEINAKGFSALVLLDMSGSMKVRWEAVSRAAKVLSRALKFPFSKFEVWGFSGDEGATIFRFLNTEKGYDGPGVQGAWGLTPLHLALEVAIRHMRRMPGSTRHLFVLTDGLPTGVGGRGVQGDLVRSIGKSVREARSCGVNIVALVIGQEVADHDANTMFGHKRFWARTVDKIPKPKTKKKVKEEDDEEVKEDLFEKLTGLVSGAFTNYLRGGRR